MAGLRGARYLDCFYCGKRSDTRYDGQISQFQCRYCDATNYLDENGEITDPPVASTSATSLSAQYAIPRPKSPSPMSPSKEIFCPTCLKNQHLFTSSLAQYLPEDPNDPEYPEYEKNLYKFRRSLEKRYPQICDDCEPKVFERLQLAGYAAKTDHLRRMMDKSRSNRQTVKSWSSLDSIHVVGRWLWYAGLVLELLWHLSSVGEALGRYGGVKAKEQVWIAQVIDGLALLSVKLPSPAMLLKLSLWSNLLAVWWNPKFPQVYRGFSRHLHGLWQWYTFQVLMIIMRIVFTKVEILSMGQKQEMDAQISAHAVMALLVTLLYVLAGRSVRTDTTPLFGDTSVPISLPRPRRPSKPSSTKNLSNILDEILTTPAPARSTSAAVHDDSLDYVPDRPASKPSRSRRSVGNLEFGRLGLSETPPPIPTQQIDYAEEMDWAPTQSPYRAFTDYGSSQRQAQGFNQAPAEPDSGPFWYKVPPAPDNPAKRLRNPAKISLLQQPLEKKEPLFSSSRSQSSSRAIHKEAEIKPPAIEFSDSRFFSPQDPGDPRNSLADLLTQSFSLGEEEDASTRHATRRRTRGARHSSRLSGLRIARLADVLMLVLMLMLWLHAVATLHEYHSATMLGVMVICGTVAIRVLVDTVTDMRDEQSASWAARLGLVLGVVELAATAHFGLLVWQSGGRSPPVDAESMDADIMGAALEGLWKQLPWQTLAWGGGDDQRADAIRGAGLIGLMIVHQLWNAFL